MTTVETVDHKGYTINIYQDASPSDPRGWDNVSQMLCLHSRYNLGDNHAFRESYELQEHLEELGSKAEVLPLYLYDHSGISMSTRPFSCRWDSGQVGYAIVTLERINELCGYGWKKWTQKRRERAREIIQGEVEMYDDFITGNVYGYEILSPEGEELNSCWGYFGDYDSEGGLVTEAKSEIDHYRSEAMKARFKRLKEFIVNRVPLYYRNLESVL